MDVMQRVKDAVSESIEKELKNIAIKKEQVIMMSGQCDIYVHIYCRQGVNKDC